MRSRRALLAQQEREGSFTRTVRLDGCAETRTSDERRRPYLDFVSAADVRVRQLAAEQHAASARAARLAILLDWSAAPLTL